MPRIVWPFQRYFQLVYGVTRCGLIWRVPQWGATELDIFLKFKKDKISHIFRLTSFAEENLSYRCTCILLDRSTLALASSTTPVNSVVGSPHMSDRGRLPPSLGHDHTDAGGNVSLTGNRYGHYLSFFAEAFCKRCKYFFTLAFNRRIMDA